MLSFLKVLLFIYHQCTRDTRHNFTMLEIDELNDSAKILSSLATRQHKSSTNTVDPNRKGSLIPPVISMSLSMQ